MMLDVVRAADERRKALIPDEQAALNVMMDAWVRLKDMGWNDAMYCPKDGTWFDAIEAGSTGIHDCRYDGKWPDGTYWIASGGDLWPSHPILFRLKPSTPDAGRAALKDTTHAE